MDGEGEGERMRGWACVWWGEGFSEMIVRWYEMLLRLGTAWISRRCKDCAFRLS